jgi:ketosteroid isomerase-like protein
VNELTDLVHRYAALVDDRDLAALARLFTDDGVLSLPDPPDELDPVHEHVGLDAIERAMGQLAAVPRTFHAVVGHVFDEAADGRTARGRVACVAHHVLDARTDLVWHVRYLDGYERTASGWRISRRELHLDLIETRPLKRARLR